MMIVALVIAAGVFVLALATNAVNSGAAPRSVPSLPIGASAPATPPPGKVWSEEHGHWHDVAQSASAPVAAPKPQPAGVAPEGKVWSSEHGHWHDAPQTAPATAAAPKPQPAGVAPEGKVWSEEHGHWHNAPQ